ncbi:MAG: hypothetical protein IJ173_10570 [Kiritimatiellae bacterium]|nr:hypothetical protein [Kiritimatiellia bacterium]
MKKLVAVAMIAAVACGCVSVNKNDGGTVCLKPAVVKDAVYEKYTISDKAVTAKAQAVGICGFIVIGDAEATHWADNVDGTARFMSTPAMAKNNAYSKACEENKCDSLVAARYSVTRKNYFVFDQATATVTGYPAKLDGIEVLPAPVPACPAQK